MAQQILSTNTFCEAKWVVSATSSAGTHTTIAAALTSAASGDTIFVLPGTYTENLTLKAGVNLTANLGDSSTPNVSITGKLTATFAGSASISNINLTTNSDNIYATSGTNATIVTFNHCTFNGTNATSISNNNINATTTLFNCIAGISGSNLFFTNTGNLNIQECYIGGASNTASTSSSGLVIIDFSGFNTPITTSSTSGFIANLSIFSPTNLTSLTCGGSGTNSADKCSFNGGTASAISVGTGSTLTIFQCVISSSNTNAITGAGAIVYGDLWFSGSSSTINTTTKTPNALTVLQGGTGLTSTTVSQILYSTSANTIAGLATANSGALITSSGGVPSISSTLPSAVQTNITAVGNLGNQLNTTRSAFLVSRSSTVNDVTGDGTVYTIAWNNEVFDQNNDFASNTFTAPVTGRYLFTLSLFFQQIGVAHNTCQIYIVSSSQLATIWYGNPGVITISGSSLIICGSAIFNCTAGDTVTVQVAIGGSTKTVDVVGAALSSGPSQWGGYLLC